MRGVLHHPAFQALESAWRSLYDLVARIELDETLQLFACDIRREELLMGLPEPGTSLGDSPLFQLLVGRRQAADDTPWAVIAGDYHFAAEPADIALLTALGAAAAANSGIFLAGASPAILGCDGVEALPDPRKWTVPGQGSLWKSLRESDIADHLGLALPRVLARLPYGAHTEPVERFEFEEMPHHNHAGYLWANPAYACVGLLAEGFTRNGWRLAPGSHVELGSLPAHTYLIDGETLLQPCAEILIPESTMVAILEQGLMPLISYRDRNTAVVGRFQSIAVPPGPLAGPWTG
jgi:type VI secretion system protein ImpC